MRNKLRTLRDGFFWKVTVLISMVLLGFVSKAYKWNDTIEIQKQKTTLEKTAAVYKSSDSN